MHYQIVQTRLVLHQFPAVAWKNIEDIVHTIVLYVTPHLWFSTAPVTSSIFSPVMSGGRSSTHVPILVTPSSETSACWSCGHRGNTRSHLGGCHGCGTPLQGYENRRYVFTHTCTHTSYISWSIPLPWWISCLRGWHHWGPLVSLLSQSLGLFCLSLGLLLLFNLNTYTHTQHCINQTSTDGSLPSSCTALLHAHTHLFWVSVKEEIGHYFPRQLSRNRSSQTKHLTTQKPPHEAQWVLSLQGEWKKSEAPTI